MSVSQPAADGVRSYGLFIDNSADPATGSPRLDVLNPATGRVWAQVPEATAADVDRAVASARRAFEEGPWPRWRAADRADFLIRFGRAIAEHAEELAALQVAENGKLMREMLGQVKLF